MQNVQYFKDIYDSGAQKLFKYKELSRNIPQLRCNYLEYHTIVSTIPKVWLRSLKLKGDRTQNNAHKVIKCV